MIIYSQKTKNGIVSVADNNVESVGVVKLVAVNNWQCNHS